MRDDDIADIKRRYAQSASLEALREHLTRQRLQRIEAVIANRQRGLSVLMEDIDKPYNLAAITRTAESFGLQHVHYTAAAPFDMANTETIVHLVASNANRWIDHHYAGDDTATALASFRAQDWRIAAAVVDPSATSLYDIAWADYDRVLLLVGNEKQGLSLPAVEISDIPFYIPMRGFTESFNVSVAAAITLAEITRQRMLSRRDFSLPDDEVQALTERFIRLSMV